MALIITIATFIASLLTLFSGFGLGTLLMPVMALFFPVTLAITLTALVHLSNNVFKLATLWKFINWHTSLTFGVPALLAALPGAWLLGYFAELPTIASYFLFGLEANVTPIKLLVGLLLIIFAVIEWIPYGKQLSIPPHYLPWGGALSGFFGGLSGHQGALRSAFLLRTGLDKNQFVATGAMISSFVDIARLIVYGLNIKLLRLIDGTLIAGTIIATLAGILVGRAVLKKVTVGFIQKLVAVMLLLLGTLLVIGVI